MLVNRRELQAVFGVAIGNSITITLSQQGIKPAKRKVEYRPSKRKGVETTARYQILYWDLSQILGYYESNTDARFAKLYAKRIKQFKGMIK